MKAHFKSLLVVTLLLLPVTFQSIAKEPIFSLTINVKGLRNSKGLVQFALYNKKGSIPDENFENYYRVKTVKIKNNRAGVTFSKIPKGTYAINILHDENENGKIDKKFLLPLPKEGIGFSNYQTIGLNNRPNFSGASFFLNKNCTREIKIIYL